MHWLLRLNLWLSITHEAISKESLIGKDKNLYLLCKVQIKENLWLSITREAKSKESLIKKTFGCLYAPIVQRPSILPFQAETSVSRSFLKSKERQWPGFESRSGHFTHLHLFYINFTLTLYLFNKKPLKL